MIFQQGISVISEKRMTKGILEFKHIKEIELIDNGIKIIMNRGTLIIYNWSDTLNKIIYKHLNDLK